MDNHLLSHAIAIATEAHKGQKDKYGQEYLHHCRSRCQAL